MIEMCTYIHNSSNSNSNSNSNTNSNTNNISGLGCYSHHHHHHNHNHNKRPEKAGGWVNLNPGCFMATSSSFSSVATAAASFSPITRRRLSPLPYSLRFTSARFSTRLILASSSSSSSSYPFGPANSRSQKSVLSDLIQEIEPLDVSVIQKDVPATTVDAMKRTISGMLGLLPSDQFEVLIESLWGPLSKLLVSSMMTGYTLRNAEYRLCLERNLDIHEENIDRQKIEDSKLEDQVLLLDNNEIIKIWTQDEVHDSANTNENITDVSDLGEMSPQVKELISKLQSSLSSVKKELREARRKSAALQMQQFVGEEKNDLLDYLRSLQPEKVAELSEPTSPELRETIHSVVHGLLATLSPKVHSKAPNLPDNASSGTANGGIKEDHADLVENTSLQFHPLVSLTRDYLARLLFWCMLLGHYVRGLEHRMELMELLSLSNDSSREDASAASDEQIA